MSSVEHVRTFRRGVWPLGAMNYHHGNLRRELLDRAAQIIAKQGI